MKRLLFSAACLTLLSGAASAQGVQPQGYTGLPYPSDTSSVSNDAPRYQAAFASSSAAHPRTKKHVKKVK